MLSFIIVIACCLFFGGDDVTLVELNKVCGFKIITVADVKPDDGAAVEYYNLVDESVNQPFS